MEGSTFAERLARLTVICKNKYGAQLDKPYAEEAKLLNEVKWLLDMCFPYVWYNREDAKTISGVPDILACIQGHFVAFELKDNIGKASAPQLAKIDCIIRSGGIAIVTRTISEVLAVLSACSE